MTEAAATRYLVSQGWHMIENGWFSLRGVYEAPVCIETAYQLQKMMDRVAA